MRLLQPCYSFMHMCAYNQKGNVHLILMVLSVATVGLCVCDLLAKQTHNGHAVELLVYVSSNGKRCPSLSKV